MTGVCAALGPHTREELGEGCAILRTPQDDGLCHKRTITILGQPDADGLWTPFVHHDCVHNQELAIANRVLGKTPPTTREGLAMMKRGAKILKRHLPKTTQEEYALFAQNYGLAKRKRYEDAAEELRTFGIRKQDAKVKMFVKCEKLSSATKRNPDPRAIQFRDPRYCVALASYLKPMEHLLYKLKVKTPNCGRLRLVGKGLNQVERAELLKRKMEAIPDCVVLSLDCSRFDKHVSREALQVEHSVYLHSNNDSEFRRLLSWQLNNVCYTDTGFRYVTRGKRMSGDMNTALGNCVLMLSMLLGAMEERGCPYDLLDDGDDCLLILGSRDNTPAFQEYLVKCFHEYGHSLKIESVCKEYHSVSWCQSNVVSNGHWNKFVRDPRKVMAHGLASPKWKYMNLRQRGEYLQGLASCEAILNRGVPVLQAYAAALKRNAGQARAVYDQGGGEYLRMLRELRSGDGDYEIVTDEARESFATAFSMPVAEQLRVEEWLSTWTFQLGGEELEIGIGSGPEWVDPRIVKREVLWDE